MRKLPRGVVRVPDVSIPVVRKVCVLMMRRVKLAEAFHRGEHRPHQKEIGDKLVLPALWQVAIMRRVMSHDNQSVLASADQHDRDHVQ
jgi:hypothetical protein